ncbi:MAG TPA: hypothetical protein VGK93_01810 [Candidatus Eisenbacteria bacterium]
MATRTGLCIYCLGPLPEFASSIEPEEILRLSDFQRVRSVRRPSSRRWMRMLASILAGVLMALAVVGLFSVCLRWLATLLSAGVRQA